MSIGSYDGSRTSEGGDYPIRRKIMLALTPPKPLEMACMIAIGRAAPDTMSMPSAPGSGFVQVERRRARPTDHREPRMRAG
jgi:hypothetical protein